MPASPREPTAFERTAELLAVCHRDIGRHLEALEAAGARAGDDPGPLRKALAFFDLMLAVHQPDEEVDVFPALLSAAVRPDERSQAYELVARLMVEHRELAALWIELRPALARIAEGRQAVPPGEARVRFAALYRIHLGREERELERLLRLVPAERLERIARSIAARHAHAGFKGPGSA